MRKVFFAVVLVIAPLTGFSSDLSDSYRRQKAVEIYEGESRSPGPSIFLKMISFDREKKISKAVGAERDKLLLEKYKEQIDLIEEGLYLDAMIRVLIEKKWAAYGVKKSFRYHFDSTFVADYEKKYPNGESAVKRMSGSGAQ